MPSLHAEEERPPNDYLVTLIWSSQVHICASSVEGNVFGEAQESKARLHYSGKPDYLGFYLKLC